MSEVWSDWIYPELINDWEPLPGWPAPRYKTCETLFEGTKIWLDGTAQGGRPDSPIAILPSDFGPFTLHSVTETDADYRVTRSQRIVIDETGFLFVKEFAYDGQRRVA